MKTFISPIVGLIIFTLSISVFLVSCGNPPPASRECRPTPPDMLGPFYKPGAPVRDTIGTGYILTGQVLSAGDCRPLPGSRIEFWLTNRENRYDDDHRATVFAGKNGLYRFESNPPMEYSGRPPHIHIMVSKQGFKQLVTQHYPSPGTSKADLDLVLTAVNQ